MFEYTEMSISPPSELVWDTFCEMLKLSGLASQQKSLFSVGINAPNLYPSSSFFHDVPTLLGQSRLGELIQREGFLQIIVHNLVFTFPVSDSPEFHRFRHACNTYQRFFHPPSVLQPAADLPIAGEGQELLGRVLVKVEPGVYYEGTLHHTGPHFECGCFALVPCNLSIGSSNSIGSATPLRNTPCYALSSSNTNIFYLNPDRSVTVSEDQRM
ncbi:hypothetical protein PC9H_008954 [Pleurotus ostreatus]|uniref:Uncharacterized protein n=2 Tax=Pleurotus ostreatus TaxID=5322 RepID=A0A067NZF2_PLEO1|nr:uncharacterized protein PC9H_008954 [Pleurotus ostreatus]KAF7426585.1 hypothetical protein PC9H_008954 [Pleurotus ostreatus]KAJ8694155.1 hypothetical protein PTI98_009087 [Pleurotus ostreatus]KDQ32335.1 hypothetical protein PLEOSDRAFT_1088246 [Pleurotus ostreatus PC15]